jgi:branched-chain amino acid transport system permease protein
MEQFFQQLINGLMIGSTYAVVALGFGLIFSVMRVVNLAHPEIFMVGAYVAFVVITRSLPQVHIGSRARRQHAPALCGLRRRLRPSRGMVPPVALVRVTSLRPARDR